MGIFFKDIEVVGDERFPRGGPLLIVGNHTNALIDPVLFIGFLPARSRMLAKSTLWNNVMLRPLLELGGAIPVYRRVDAADGRADMSRNEEMFARCHDELGTGGAIALFPEGTSHNEPSLLPLKTGAARIVLEAMQKYEGLGVKIVPVGLIFDERTRFRSRALLQVGEPIDPQAWVDDYTREPQAAVASLTEHIGEALAGVTLNYASWEEARLVERVADLYAQPDTDVPDTLPLAERARLRKAFVDGYRQMREKDPQRVDRVYRRVKQYDRLLRVFDLRTAQVASRYPGSLVVWFIARTFRLVLLRLPLTILGVLLNWLPYRIPGWVARAAADDPDEEATYKVFTGFFLFPVFWLLWSGLAAWWLGWLAFPIMMVLAPLSGYVALKARDQREQFREEARAFLLLRTNKRIAAELQLRHRALHRDITALVEEFQRG